MGEQLTRSSLSFISSEQLQMIKANCQFELHFFIPADNQSYADPDKIVSLSTMSYPWPVQTPRRQTSNSQASLLNISIDHMDNVTLLQLQFISCLSTFLIKIDLIDCINVALFFSASCHHVTYYSPALCTAWLPHDSVYRRQLPQKCSVASWRQVRAVICELIRNIALHL